MNGYTADAFIDAVKADFEVEAVTEAYQPEEKAAFGMYLDGIWYKLRAKSHILSEDPVDGLDVSILQDHLLAPILGIEIQEPIKNRFYRRNPRSCGVGTTCKQ